MLLIIKGVSRKTGKRVRVIRRDCVMRCGPLGGILTALKSSSADRILFLACDMPFVSVELLKHLLGGPWKGGALFVRSRSGVGFPFLLPVAAAAAVARQIERGALSLQDLARVCQATRLPVPRKWGSQLDNVNTPRRYWRARKIWKNRTLARRS